MNYPNNTPGSVARILLHGTSSPVPIGFLACLGEETIW